MRFQLAKWAPVVALATAIGGVAAFYPQLAAYFGWGTHPVAAQQQQRAFQLPTATEVFNLRSKCAAMGEKIMAENPIGPGLTQSQVSHYNPQTNRCYVEVTTQNADLTKGVTYLTRTLFDGQTKELLAFAKIENGRNNGEIFDRQRNAPLNAGYTDTAGYIDEMMADDRR